MRFTPEYPPYCDDRHPHHDPHPMRADWDETNLYSPAYILHKPDVILEVNGEKPVKGKITLDAKKIGIGAIPNDEIYKIVKDVFEV